jgi:chaperonin GroEL
VLEDVAVFLHERKLATIKPMAPVIERLRAEGKSILVIAEDVTDEALAILAFNTQKGALKACAAKSPGSVEHLHDIAALTGARVVTELSSTKLKDIDESYFGHAKRVILKSQNATIIAGASSDRLTQRLQELRTQVSEATDEGQKLRLQSRLARLAGGVAIIRVGAATELEMLERKDRIEDAMHATRCAIKEGVVAGGGIALLRAGLAIPNYEVEFAAGAEIVRRACFAPLRTLVDNAGKSPEYVTEQILSHGGSPDYGWNARNELYGDMYEMGIIDPLRVVRVALESASSVAALMLITHCLVANERPK